MATTTDSLDAALAAAPLEEVDARIGDRALERYEEQLDAARSEASEAIVGWWRKQPADVVDELLGAMRERDQIAVEHMEEKTGKTGLDLLAALLREDGMNGGRSVYEREIEHRLTTLRAAGACDDGIDKPMIAAALAGLDADAISTSFGVTATKHYATRIAHEERHEAGEIARRWKARPWGKRAVEEIVATLADNHTAEVLAATEKSTGGAYADLVEILRDETTRELYTLLVTRMAQEANAKGG